MARALTTVKGWRGHCGDVGKLVLSACAVFQAGKRLPRERRAGSSEEQPCIRARALIW